MMNYVIGPADPRFSTAVSKELSHSATYEAIRTYILYY